MEQRTDEWFAARKGRVTASIAGALLGHAPYMSVDDAMRILVRSMHDLPSEFKGNIATDYGTFNEDGALVEYKMESGNLVEQVGFVPFSDWLGASPDGLVNKYGLVEIKCPFGLRKTAAPVPFKSISDQPHYYAQMQIQMFCTKRDWCDFYQWTPNGTSVEYVAYNTNWISENLPKLKSAWDAASKADPKDYDGELRRVIDTPEVDMLVTEYDEMREAADNAKERCAQIIERLVVVSNGNDAKVAGRNLTLVKRKGSVSYAKAIATYAPKADLEPYRGKPSESWQLK